MPLYDSARVAAALPGYTLGDPLGVGASGLVIAGWHHGLQRDVAVKILHRAPDRPAAGFATEARLLAGLDHPHVVRVYDFVEKDDFSLLVMEKLSGGTLRSRQPTLTPPAACAVGLATSAALAYAHTRGVLHRDIKPDNILFDSAGLPKVADFGIARAVNDSGPATSTVIGTPLYMAPEQLAGGRLRPATDVYALGVVLYEMLTGVHPADQGQLAGDESGPPAPPDVPHRLAVVLAGALARDPLERTGSAHAFAFDLARAAALEFGSDWLSRSGMSIQVDHELLVTAALVPPGALTSSVGAGSGGGPPGGNSWRGSSSGGGSSAGALPAGVRPAGRSAGGGPGGRWPAGRRDRADRTGQVGRSRQPERADDLLGPRAGEAAGRGTPARLTGGGRSLRLRLVGPAHKAAIMIGVLALAVGGSGVAFAFVFTREPEAKALGQPLDSYRDWALAAVFSPDGQVMATSDKTGDVWLWEVRDPSAPSRIGRQLDGPMTGVTSLAFSPDGRALAGGGWDGSVWMWDVTDRYAPAAVGIRLSGHVGPVWSVAFAPDGRTLVSGGDDATVRLWDTRQRAAPVPIGQPLTGLDGYVTSVALSADGQLLAAAGEDSSVLLWDVTDPAAPRLHQHGPRLPTPVYVVAFAPRGRTLATGGADGVIRLWDVNDPEGPRPIGRELRGHTNRVWSLAFAPDGDTLASGGLDSAVRLWDVSDPAAPRPRSRPATAHRDWVLSVRFSPDGAVLATASADATVRLWSVP